MTGVAARTLCTWAGRASTSYGYELNVIDHGKHRLIDEQDLRVIMQVNRKFPLTTGAPERKRAEEMRRYALQIRAALTPAP
jgi:hypothetical protein